MYRNFAGALKRPCPPSQANQSVVPPKKSFPRESFIHLSLKLRLDETVYPNLWDSLASSNSFVQYGGYGYGAANGMM